MLLIFVFFFLSAIESKINAIHILYRNGPSVGNAGKLLLNV